MPFPEPEECDILTYCCATHRRAEVALPGDPGFEVRLKPFRANPCRRRKSFRRAGDAMARDVSRAVRIWSLAVLGLFLLTVSLRGFGQDTNASLSGTVTDPSGAAIPRAKLTITNEATSFQSSFVSDETGAYTFRNLTPGKYHVDVTAAGFKSA